MLAWPFKDPDEILDYVIDWADRLGPDDEISSSQWILDPAVGAVVQDGPDEMTTTTTTIWLKQGTEGATYTLTNRVTTTGGRTMDQSVRLKVKTK